MNEKSFLKSSSNTFNRVIIRQGGSRRSKYCTNIQIDSRSHGVNKAPPIKYYPPTTRLNNLTWYQEAVQMNLFAHIHLPQDRFKTESYLIRHRQAVFEKHSLTATITERVFPKRRLECLRHFRCTHVLNLIARLALPRFRGVQIAFFVSVVSEDRSSCIRARSVFLFSSPSPLRRNRCSTRYHLRRVDWRALRAIVQVCQ